MNKKLDLGSNCYIEVPIVERIEQENNSKSYQCRNTTREALEILLGMNVQSDVSADPGLEGPSTGEESEEPEIITAARNLRSKLVKEGIL